MNGESLAAQLRGQGGQHPYPSILKEEFVALMTKQRVSRVSPAADAAERAPRAGRLRRGLGAAAPLQRLICPAFKFLVISPSKSGRILLCFSAPRRWRSSTLLYQSFIHCSASRIFLSLGLHLHHLRRIFLSFFGGGRNADLFCVEL